MGRKNRREWGKEVEIGKMRRWVRGIAVAEGEDELPKEASGKRSRRCTMSESAWFPVQEQCGKGAQAVNGHSANSIILLVAKFKTQQLWDCECYIQGLIFILSLWGRTFAYKSVYRSVYKTINDSKPGLKVTEQWPRACAREFESDSSWQLFKFPREHWLSALYWRPGHVRTHTRPLRAGRDSQQSGRKVQNWGATVSESGLVKWVKQSQSRGFLLSWPWSLPMPNGTFGMFALTAQSRARCPVIGAPALASDRRFSWPLLSERTQRSRRACHPSVFPGSERTSWP